MKIKIILLLLLTLTCLKNYAQVVKTDKGYVRGVTENNIAVFKGIPYAAPPVAGLRFMPPVPHSMWTDTLDATKFGEIASQPSGKAVQGGEDCLSMNIYTPETDNKKRAVVVWVHGGSMTNGAGKGMNGHAFADNDDIVTVTINYRLGALGFLYLGDIDKKYAQSGNCGLLDCVAALNWTHKNIAAFGGDPNRVTIMGESAGAKLISAVMMSPASKGLVQQYILESGSVQCIRDSNTAKNERLRILKQLGLTAKDVRQLLTLPADTIMKAQAVVCAGLGGNSFFGPVYDGVTIKGDAYKYVAAGNIKNIRTMIGTNKYEAALFLNKNEWQKHGTDLLKPLFESNYPMVYKTYQQELQHGDAYDAAVRIVTQYMYQMHSYRLAKVLSATGTPVYMYRFDFNDNKPYGAKHAAELQYVWSNPKSSGATGEKAQLEKLMHNAWVSFIKTGNPNTTGLPQWPLYSNSKKEVMLFDSTNQVSSLKEVFDDKDFPSAVFVIK